MVIFFQVIDSDQHNWFSYVHSFFFLNYMVTDLIDVVIWTYLIELKRTVHNII